MKYKIEFSCKSTVIEEVEAETLSEAVTNIARQVMKNLDGSGIYEFSIKEHKEQGNG
jgi:hypothetical protein